MTPRPDTQSPSSPGRYGTRRSAPSHGTAVERERALLQAAAQRVAATWTENRDDTLRITTAPELLASLVRAVDRHWAGRPIAADARMASPLGLRLLELLRRELIWSPPDGRPEPNHATVLALLRALDQVSDALDPDGGRDFAAPLSGPGGLQLLVGIAHDLRSPLTSILFLAENLQLGRSGDVNELQHRQLGLMYGAALGLSAFAGDLIELVQGGQRLVEPEPVPFSIKHMFESVDEIVRPIAEEKHLMLRLLPPAAGRHLGHPPALSRVLLNLTTNALKFTETGFVELVAHETGDWRVAFSVRDTGRGIGPAALETLYQPFRWSEGRSGYGFSSTGLGLALCRKLVEIMGSELRVETRPSWGTRFHFDLELPPA